MDHDETLVYKAEWLRSTQNVASKDEWPSEKVFLVLASLCMGCVGYILYQHINAEDVFFGTTASISARVSCVWFTGLRPDTWWNPQGVGWH